MGGPQRNSCGPPFFLPRSFKSALTAAYHGVSVSLIIFGEIRSMLPS